MKCNEKFTVPGMRRHKGICHGAKEQFDCPECGMIFNSAEGVKRHSDQDHKMELVKSRIVCKHWRKGNCFKGDKCGFSHVGKQNHSEPMNTNKTSTRVPACNNGPSCEWLSKGSCSYFHPRVGVQKPWVKNKTQGGRQQTRTQGGRQQTLAQGGRQEPGTQEGQQQTGAVGGRRLAGARGDRRQDRAQGGRQQSGAQEGRQRTLIQPDRDQCRFDGRCERIPNCPYIHSMEDFPPLQGRKNPVPRVPANRRNNYGY